MSFKMAMGRALLLYLGIALTAYAVATPGVQGWQSCFGGFFIGVYACIGGLRR